MNTNVNCEIIMSFKILCELTNLKIINIIK